MQTFSLIKLHAPYSQAFFWAVQVFVLLYSGKVLQKTEKKVWLEELCSGQHKASFKLFQYNTSVLFMEIGVFNIILKYIAIVD